MPRDLAERARLLAEWLGTTPNDALLLMAERGAALYATELHLARNEAHQWAAVLDAMGPLDPNAEFLPDEEAREAVLLLRSGKFGPVV